jgi:hypothetical protein
MKVATIALLEYSSDTEIDPRAATRGLEDIGSSRRRPRPPSSRSS